MMKDDSDYRRESPDLRCAEAREVMQAIPPAIVRWGMTVMACIVGMILAAACFIDWPQISSCPCTVQAIQADSCRVSVTLTAQVVESLAKKHLIDFSVTSPLMDEGCEIKGTVGIQDIRRDADGGYTAGVNVRSPEGLQLQEYPGNTLEGDAVFLISDKKLIIHLFPSLEKLRFIFSSAPY